MSEVTTATKTKTTSKTERVLSALENGDKLTAKQIGARFGVANPTAMVSNLRMNGYPVHKFTSKDTKGRATTKYRMSRPSRKVIAAGYAARAEMKRLGTW